MVHRHPKGFDFAPLMCGALNFWQKRLAVLLPAQYGGVFLSERRHADDSVQTFQRV